MELRKFKRKRLSKAFRVYIFEWCNYECQRCYENLIDKPHERVIDHKIPLSKGGSNAIGNLWLLCRRCDRVKKDSVEPELLADYMKNRLRYLMNKNEKK
jgi:5-methylcytosine-specific restriction endonuclease McrA